MTRQTRSVSSNEDSIVLKSKEVNVAVKEVGKGKKAKVDIPPSATSNEQDFSEFEHTTATIVIPALEDVVASIEVAQVEEQVAQDKDAAVETTEENNVEQVIAQDTEVTPATDVAKVTEEVASEIAEEKSVQVEEHVAEVAEVAEIAEVTPTVEVVTDTVKDAAEEKNGQVEEQVTEVEEPIAVVEVAMPTMEVSPVVETETNDVTAVEAVDVLGKRSSPSKGEDEASPKKAKVDAVEK